jgi:hypothetical protein
MFVRENPLHCVITPILHSLSMLHFSLSNNSSKFESYIISNHNLSGSLVAVLLEVTDGRGGLQVWRVNCKYTVPVS